MTGGWDRDLNRDLDAIRDWGAAAVVTLLEPKELTLLRVERSVIFDLLKPPRRRRRARAAV